MAGTATWPGSRRRNTRMWSYTTTIPTQSKRLPPLPPLYHHIDPPPAPRKRAENHVCCVFYFYYWIHGYEPDCFFLFVRGNKFIFRGNKIVNTFNSSCMSMQSFLVILTKQFNSIIKLILMRECVVISVLKWYEIVIILKVLTLFYVVLSETCVVWREKFFIFAFTFLLSVDAYAWNNI